MNNFIKSQTLFFCFLTGIIFYSCSSSKPSKTLNKKNANASIDHNFDWITNDDFKSRKIHKLNIYNDYYSQYDSEKKLFADETLDNSLRAQQHSKVLVKDKSVLTNATVDCYNNKFGAAHKSLANSYKTNNQNSRYYNISGLCYFKQKKMELALLNFNKAIFLNRKYAPPYNNIALIYRARGDFYNSVKYFKKSIKYAPNSKIPKFNLALVYLKFGILNKAKYFFKKLLKYNIKDRDINYLLAEIALAQNNYTLSFKYLSNYLDDEAFLDNILQISKRDKQGAFLKFKEHYQLQLPVYIRNLKLKWGR